MILSTIHSAKGQEWDFVYVLNVADGNFPSEFSTGKPELIEEERRLLYVAMTRARNELHLCAPLKYAVTQQAKDGDAHVYGAKSRFMTDKVMECFERMSFRGSRASELEPEARRSRSRGNRGRGRATQRNVVSAHDTARDPPRGPERRRRSNRPADLKDQPQPFTSGEVRRRRPRHPAAWIGRPFLGLVDSQRTATHLEAVRLLNRVLRLACRHVHERKTAGAAGLAIVDELDGFDFAVALEQATNFVFRRGEWQVANVDRRHSTSLTNSARKARF